MSLNMPQSEYWAVCCPCGKFIPLSLLYREPETDKIIAPPSEPELFEAACEDGHNGTFAKSQAVGWLGPAVIYFHTHSAFIPLEPRDV